MRFTHPPYPATVRLPRCGRYRFSHRRRDAKPVIPRRVEYSLTSRGGEIVALLIPLMEWIAANADDIASGAA